MSKSITHLSILRPLLLFALSIQLLTAQKVVSKSLVDSTITSFQIDTSNCFKVALQTSDTDTITVEATIDGEYRKDLVLKVREAGTTALVSAGFQPNFENPNDKLSAHKVISIALSIRIPAERSVHVFGTHTNVSASGRYSDLKVSLNDGAATLLNVSGKATVATQSGDIFVAGQAAEIKSNSKYGQVGENRIPHGDTKYLLNSVTGNIRFERIE